MTESSSRLPTVDCVHLAIHTGSCVRRKCSPKWGSRRASETAPMAQRRRLRRTWTGDEPLPPCLQPLIPSAFEKGFH